MKFKPGATKCNKNILLFSSSATLGLRSTFVMLIYGVLLTEEMFEIAVDLIQSNEHHIIGFRGFCPLYEKTNTCNVFLRRISLTKIRETDKIHERR